MAEEIQGGKAPQAQAQATPEGISKLKDMLDMSYPDFISALTGKTNIPTEGEVLADIDDKVHAVLNMGMSDLNEADEKIKTDLTTVSCKDLWPTQSQIGLNDSIGFVAFENPGAAISNIDDQVSFGGGRILTANKKWILDGHHRWSGVSILNPDAQIPVLDLNLPDVKNESDMLKVVQLAIAATYDKLLMKPANAPTDIFDDAKSGANCEKLPEMLKKIFKGGYGVPKDGDINNVPIFLKNVEEKWGTDEEGVIAKLTENAKNAIKSKKPSSEIPRAIMPQPSDTAKAEKLPNKDGDGKMPAAFLTKLKDGSLNFKKPLTAEKENIKKEPITAESKKWIKTFEQFKVRK